MGSEDELQITIPWSLNRMVAEMTPLIDLLADPLSIIRQPEEYAWATVELRKLLSDPDNWEKLHAVKEGKRTNYAIHNLGQKRMEWMDRWYKERVEGR